MTFGEIIKEVEKQKHEFFIREGFLPNKLEVSADVYCLTVFEANRHIASSQSVGDIKSLYGLELRVTVTEKNKYIKVS